MLVYDKFVNFNLATQGISMKKLNIFSDFVLPVIFIFVIPVSSYFFFNYTSNNYDEKVLDSIATGISNNISEYPNFEGKTKSEIMEGIASVAPSAVCGQTDEANQEMRNNYKDICSDLEQFSYLKQLSFWSMVVGVVSILLILLFFGLSLLHSPKLHYLSFVTCWNMMKIVCLVQVLAQGVLITFLSYWVPAYLFERYFAKIILIVAGLVLIAAFMMIKAIFSRNNEPGEIEGQLLTKADSPKLWARIGEITQKIGTEGPDNIVLGIDDNFFVTEGDLRLNGQILKGRTLYASIFQLKNLNLDEADAIFSHEMAHFSGEDTFYSKKMGPKLFQFGQYMEGASAGGIVSYPVYSFMMFFYQIFNVSIQRMSRLREFRADGIAANVTSANSICDALIRFIAYSEYRAKIENDLYGENQNLTELNILDKLSTGFKSFTETTKLDENILEAEVSHPYDSHPTLRQRIAKLGESYDKKQVADTIHEDILTSWYNDIQNAEQIETKLMAEYEEKFRVMHESSLPYRYLPSNPQEKEVVEKYFPKREIALKNEKHTLSFDFESMTYTDWHHRVEYKNIEDMNVADGYVNKTLVIKQNDTVPKDQRKLKLPIGKFQVSEDELLEALNAYVVRYRSAVLYIEENKES